MYYHDIISSINGLQAVNAFSAFVGIVVSICSLVGLQFFGQSEGNLCTNLEIRVKYVLCPLARRIVHCTFRSNTMCLSFKLRLGVLD
jgi:hypothetical protein